MAGLKTTQAACFAGGLFDARPPTPRRAWKARHNNPSLDLSPPACPGFGVQLVTEHVHTQVS